MLLTCGLCVCVTDSGLEVLAVQRVSKAQAWQRAGRAGREDSGSCYRLYTEQEFDSLIPMTVPEIQRYCRDCPPTGMGDKVQDAFPVRLCGVTPIPSLTIPLFPLLCACTRHRCNLAGVMLQLMALGIPDVMNFDFMSKPSPGKLLLLQLDRRARLHMETTQ